MEMCEWFCLECKGRRGDPTLDRCRTVLMTLLFKFLRHEFTLIFNTWKTFSQLFHSRPMESAARIVPFAMCPEKQIQISRLKNHSFPLIRFLSSITEGNKNFHLNNNFCENFTVYTKSVFYFFEVAFGKSIYFANFPYFYLYIKLPINSNKRIINFCRDSIFTAQTICHKNYRIHESYVDYLKLHLGSVSRYKIRRGMEEASKEYKAANRVSGNENE